MSRLTLPAGPPRLQEGGYKSFRRSLSVHGDSGGRNIRASYGFNSLGSGFDLAGGQGIGLGGGGGGGGGIFLSSHEKVTMQNLNDRLAAYLEKVRTLEAANTKLELQIREWYEKQTPVKRDYSKYEAVVADLHKKIFVATSDNARLMLQIDNARLAAEDFRVKFDSERALLMSVEADISGLRKLLDELTTNRSNLEMQVEGQREELVYLKKNHDEEMAALLNQVRANTVNVEVDAKPQAEMGAVMAEIRAQYEAIVEKNRREMENWYKGKFDELNKQVASSTEDLQISRTQISELKRNLQALQIELQSQLSLKAALEGQLTETEARYSLEMSQLQAMVDSLEAELGNMRVDIERQAREYQILLDIKTRLELEIAEYRRLLDGEDVTTVVIEEIVDGQVVSYKEDVDTEVLEQ
uniref:IF rod domain-containing protein n=1 Tax=Mola mola TaxID=94237 RepID=A0A3Q3VXP4_MOLML